MQLLGVRKQCRLVDGGECWSRVREGTVLQFGQQTRVWRQVIIYTTTATIIITIIIIIIVVVAAAVVDVVIHRR